MPTLDSEPPSDRGTEHHTDTEQSLQSMTVIPSAPATTTATMSPQVQGSTGAAQSVLPRRTNVGHLWLSFDLNS